MPKIIDHVFEKTSQNARFLSSENERFGLVFVKTRSINSGTGGKLATGINDTSGTRDKICRCVVDTSGEFATGVVETDNKFAASVVDSGGAF